MSDTNGAEAAPSLDYITPDDGFSATTSDAAETEAADTAPEGDETGDEQELDPDLDLDGERTDDEAEAELEEIERNGKKAKIPAWLKDELLMRDDYTRKTTEVAKARKELEGQFASLQQEREAAAQQAKVQSENIQEFAHLHNLNSQLEQYEKVDWDAWEEKDPYAAQSAWRQFQQLERTRNNLGGQLQQKIHKAAQDHQQRNLEMQQTAEAQFAKHAEETMKVLSDKVKGWNDSVAKEVISYAQTEAAGYSLDEVRRAVSDPRAFILLHKAMKYDQAVAKSAAARAKAAVAEPVEPLTPVARGKSSPAPVGLDDRLSADEWVKRRNAQMRGR